jgi:uncharacterized protein
MSDSFVTITVRVTPRGGRDAVIGWRAADGVLLLRVAAPPVEGAANKAVANLLAETLGVKRGQVTLTSGETSRDKRFRVDGLTADALNERLSRLPAAA